MSETTKLIETLRTFLLEKKELSLESAYFITKAVNESIWNDLYDGIEEDDVLDEDAEESQESEEEYNEPEVDDEEMYEEEPVEVQEEDLTEDSPEEDLVEDDLEILEPKSIKKRPGGKPKQPGNPTGKPVIRKPKLTLRK